MHVTTTDGAITRTLRRTVLRPGWPPERPIPGDDRPDAVHVGAFVDAEVDAGGLLGACLLLPQPCSWRPETPAWQLRSMAVDPDHRGEGVGRAVLAGAVEVADARGAALLWCHARVSAVGFWEREGWLARHPEGDARRVYVDAETGLEHLDMYRAVRLSRPTSISGDTAGSSFPSER